jgi:hypothetical protein
MIARALADLVLAFHLAFVVFVVIGGVFVLRWPRVAWLHIPLAIYGAIVEFIGFVCPLTPLENWLRRKGGDAGYSGDFIDHYITATLYPTGLTRRVQLVLGVGVLAVNVAIYTWVMARRRR